MSLFLVFLAGTCGAAAAAFLRIAAVERPAMISAIGFAIPQALAYRGIAVMIYGIGFVLYAAVLKRLPLTIVYPLMVGITMVEIFAFSAMYGDQISARPIAGASIVVIGVYLLLSR